MLLNARVSAVVFSAMALYGLSCPESLSAQVRRNQERDAPTVDVSGDFVAMAGEVLQLKPAAGDPLLLRLSRTTKVSITGTAKPDVLGPGTFISFFAEVDLQQSRIEEKVDRLTIFTPFTPPSERMAPAGGRPLGAFPDQMASPDLAGADDAAAEAPATEEAPRRRTRGKKDAGPTKGRFEIVGRIQGVDKSGTITVFIPNNRYFKPAVQFQLAEEPEITLDLTDPKTCAFARPGDKVKARGRQMAPNMVQATDLSISLVEPFTTVRAEDPDKKKPARRTTRSSRRKPDESEKPAEEEEKKDEEKKDDD